MKAMIERNTKTGGLMMMGFHAATSSDSRSGGGGLSQGTKSMAGARQAEPTVVTGGNGVGGH